MSRADLTIAGLREIADHLGVHPQTVKGWRARGLLDRYEVGTVSGAPAYDLDAVRSWYETSPPQPGRPPGAK
jgi:hypothetical protein